MHDLSKKWHVVQRERTDLKDYTGHVYIKPIGDEGFILVDFYTGRDKDKARKVADHIVMLHNKWVENKIRDVKDDI